MPDAILFLLLASLVVGVALVIYFTVRYQRYLEVMRSGSGKKPKPVWKPFWFD